jgi:hypothetical protein
MEKDASTQLAVWRNGGSTPAETAVRKWNFVPRMNICGSRHCPKPPGRYLQWRTVQYVSIKIPIKNTSNNPNKNCIFVTLKNNRYERRNT